VRPLLGMVSVPNVITPEPLLIIKADKSQEARNLHGSQKSHRAQRYIPTNRPLKRSAGDPVSIAVSEPFGLLGRVDLPGVPESVGVARRFVAGVLAGVACGSVDEVVLLVSEVCSNAVRHSDSGRGPEGRVTVVVAHYRGVIHIEVIDEGAAVSAPRLPEVPADDGEGGRGLWLVDQVASAWGWYEAASGRVVWFQMSYR